MDDLLDRLIAQALRIRDLETELQSTKDELVQVSMHRNSMERRLLDQHVKTFEVPEPLVGMARLEAMHRQPLITP